MTTLHLMVGLPCSGKTTYARKLAAEENALLLTPDEWQREIFGLSVYAPDSDHDKIHGSIEKIMWRVAARTLALGTSVILDFGFWAREERDYFRQQARELQVGFEIHYMSAAKEELFQRLERRNQDTENTFFIIDPVYLEKWIGQFEVPTEEELTI